MAQKKKLFKVVPRYDYTTIPTTCTFGVVSTTATPGVKGDGRWPLALDPLTGQPAVYARQDVAELKCQAIEHYVLAADLNREANALAEPPATGPAPEAEPAPGPVPAEAI